MMACDTTTGPLLTEDPAKMNPIPNMNPDLKMNPDPQPWLKGEEEIKNEFTHATWDQPDENTPRKLVFCTSNFGLC